METPKPQDQPQEQGDGQNQGGNNQQSNDLNYFEILKRSFKIVWSNKFLWVLGILVALGAGGGNFRISDSVDSFSEGIEENSQKESTINDSELDYNYQEEVLAADPTFQKMEKFWEDYMIQIILVAVILIVIGIIIKVISTFAKGGLIHAVNQIDRGEKIGFKKAFGFGIKKFWLFVLAWLVGFGLVLAIMILIGGPIGLLIWGAVAAEEASKAIFIILATLFGILGAIILVFGIILINVTILFAIYFNIIHEIPFFKGMKKGFKFFFKNFGKLFIAWLLVLGLAIAVGLVLLMGYIPLLIILGLIGFGVWAATESIIVTVIAGIGLWLIYLAIVSVVGGFFTAIYTSYWVMIFNRLNHINQLKLKGKD
jgi:hypothetical protein